MESQPSLSPEEIAEFTQALNPRAGEDRARRDVRPYDFLHPDKLSKGHLRVIQNVLLGLEKSWSEALSASLRGDVLISLETLEQVSFSAYVESVQSIRHVATFHLMGRDFKSLPKLDGTGFIDLPAALALGIVDRLAGGKGVWRGAERGLTPIEQKIVGRVLERVLAEFAGAWQPVVGMKAELSGPLPSAEDAGIGSTEAVIVAGFTCKVAGGEHRVNLVIPAGALEPVKDSLTQERWLEGRCRGLQIREDGSGIANPGPSYSINPGPSSSANPGPSGSLLGKVTVEVAAELGRAKVSMQDVLSIGLGDVIRLDRSVDEALDVTVQGHPKFQGRPGLAGNKLAVQITQESPHDAGAPAASNTAHEPEAVLEQVS